MSTSIWTLMMDENGTSSLCREGCKGAYSHACACTSLHSCPQIIVKRPPLKKQETGLSSEQTLWSAVSLFLEMGPILFQSVSFPWYVRVDATVRAIVCQLHGERYAHAHFNLMFNCIFFRTNLNSQFWLFLLRSKESWHQLHSKCIILEVININYKFYS